MSNYLTDAEELTRRYDLAERTARRVPAAPRTPRARTRVAASLRRAADRLDQ